MSHVELVDDGDGDRLLVRIGEPVAVVVVRATGDQQTAVVCSLEDVAAFARELRTWVAAQGYDDPLDPWAVPEVRRFDGSVVGPEPRLPDPGRGHES